MLSEHFYTSPKRTDRSTDSTSMLIKSPYTNSQIYSSRNIFPNDLPVYALGLTDRSQPIRSSASSADPADVELVSQHSPQAQLEALRDLHSTGSSWLLASLALLDLFDSARFDPSGRLVCSCGPHQLFCCCGVDASSAAFSSAWASVDSAYLNQTSEPTRLPPIGFRSRPSWLSPTRLRSSRP